MEQLNLPTYNFKIIIDNSQNKIFDSIRKKYVVLTPEEWVRQNFIQYLIHEKQYPASLIAVEISLKYNTLPKRADIVVYNKKGEPSVLVECKASSVKITQETFHQAAVYNMNFKVDYLIVTNGLHHYCCRMNYSDKTYLFLSQIPDFE
jgi:hypothetical protein